MTFLSYYVSMETINQAFGIFGVILAVLALVFAWRKSLLNTGFKNWQSTYRIEMNDFKATIRDYISKSDDKTSKTLERIAELYQETHDEIRDQNKVCAIVQSSKRILSKQEKEWRERIEHDIERINLNISKLSK